MVDTDPILRLGLMHPCPLISRKKNLFTTRPQDAAHHDTSPQPSLLMYSLTHLLTYVLTCLLGWLIAYLLAYLITYLLPEL